jgi:amino acid adenylation domain-containing protein
VNQKKYPEQRRIAAQQNVKERDFWLNQLSGQLVKTYIPYDHQAGKSGKNETQNRRHSLEFAFTSDEEVFTNLMKLGKGSDYTLNLLLIAGLILVISKYTGTNDVMLGMPIYQQETDGEFINTMLVLRNSIENRHTVKEFLLQVRQNIFTAVENQNYPIELLATQLDIERPDIETESPFFDIAFLLENIHKKEYLQQAPCNMVFFFCRADEALKGMVEYNSLLYEKTTVEKIITCFTHVLCQAIKDVNVPVSSIDILTGEEKKKLLDDFNNARVDYPKGKTIHQCFEEQVEKKPTRIAVHSPPYLNTPYDLQQSREVDSHLDERVNEKENHREKDQLNCITLTYGQLNNRANQLARKLRKRGITADSIVAITAMRSVGMIIGIIAILKAGGAYMPIDPDYPAERKKILLEDSSAAAALTHEHLAGENKILLQRIAHENVLFLDRKAAYSGPIDNLENINQPGNLAYLIYTSGTTGKPKGVMLCHRNVNNLIAGLKARIYHQYKTHQPLKIALLSPFIFDASVKQVFGALLQGHALHIVPEDVRADALRLLEFYRAQQIDISDGTPAHLRMVVEAMADGSPDLSVSHFLIGGEPLPRKLVNRFYDHFKQEIPAPKIINLYGPTECCVDATSYEVSRENLQTLETDQVPIGKPMPNCQVYIMGKDLRLKPLGATGELCIPGDGVGQGYWKQAPLTNEKFTSNPFGNGKAANEPTSKLYRTGDLACWYPDGNLLFRGRIDRQVKIRGFRIELEEIQGILGNHEQVEEALVAVPGLAPGSRDRGTSPPVNKSRPINNCS